MIPNEFKIGRLPRRQLSTIGASTHIECIHTIVRICQIYSDIHTNFTQVCPNAHISFIFLNESNSTT